MGLLAGLRLALRRRRVSPLLTVLAVAFLAAVIGMSTTVGSAVHSLFSRPAGVPRPQEERALSEPLRTHLQNERLDTVTSIRGLPLGVRDALEKLFGTGGLDIANPGDDFQSPGKPGLSLPLRRLVAAGCSTDHCLVHYERGGSTHTWHVALFHWTPDATRFEWGASVPSAAATLDDVRKGVLSGAINRPNSIW